MSKGEKGAKFPGRKTEENCNGKRTKDRPLSRDTKSFERGEKRHYVN